MNFKEDKNKVDNHVHTGLDSETFAEFKRQMEEFPVPISKAQFLRIVVAKGLGIKK